MDVERIQKINNLALDLVKQGLAVNRDEAIAQAEKVFTQEERDDYNSIIEMTDEARREVNESNAEAAEPQEQQESAPAQQELSKERIKDILQQNSQFLVKKIQEFQERILAMEKEMNSMKSKIAYNNIPSAGQILTKEDVKEPEPEPQPQQEAKQEANSDGNHPRSGNYNGQDVSIEKFFYMGSK